MLLTALVTICFQLRCDMQERPLYELHTQAFRVTSEPTVWVGILTDFARQYEVT